MLMPKKRRRRRRGGGKAARVLSVLLAAVVIVAALTLFFKVEEIEVTGCRRYTPEEVAIITQVEKGDNLILLDRFRVKQRIFEELPYVSEVRVGRRLPDTLVVEITETGAAAAVESGGAWWLLSKSGKVLEMVEEAQAAEYLLLENLTVEPPAVSSRLAVSEESPLTAERLTELMEELDKRDMLTRADSIDAGDPDQLVISYDGRFRVEIFYDADFPYKLDSLRKVVEALQPNETGIIRMNMQADNEVRFIPDA